MVFSVMIVPVHLLFGVGFTGLFVGENHHKLVDWAENHFHMAAPVNGNFRFPCFVILTFDGFNYPPEWPAVAVHFAVLNQDDIALRWVWSLFVPFRSYLEVLKILSSPANPELIREGLRSSPSSLGVQVLGSKVSGRWS